jgi:hypothetical protein
MNNPGRKSDDRRAYIGGRASVNRSKQFAQGNRVKQGVTNV